MVGGTGSRASELMDLMKDKDGSKIERLPVPSRVFAGTGQ